MKTNIKHWIVDQIVDSLLKTKYDKVILSMESICNKKFKDIFYLLDDNDMKRIVNELALKKILINQDLLWEDTILNSVFNIGMYSPDDMYIPPSEYRSFNIDSSSSIDVISCSPTPQNINQQATNLVQTAYTGDFEVDIANLANKYPHALLIGCKSEAECLYASMLPAWQKLLNVKCIDPKKALADAINEYWAEEVGAGSCVDKDQILTELFDSLGYDYPYSGTSDDYDDEEEDISTYEKNKYDNDDEDDDEDDDERCEIYDGDTTWVSGYVDMENVMTHTDSGLIAYVFSYKKTEECNVAIDKECFIVKVPKGCNSTGIVLFNDPITKQRL
jgi:hypothetical protein